MQDYQPYELRAMFRAGHSQFWEVADKAGILSRMGVTLSYLEGTDDPRIAEEALCHQMVERLGSVPRRQVAHAALAKLVPPTGGGLLIVWRYRAEEQVLLIEVVFRHVLLVENVVVLHAGGNWMALVFDPYRETVRSGMAAKIAAE